MDQKELNKIYNKNIRPKIIFGTINALLAFILIVFFLGLGFSRCSSGKIQSTGKITILPEPLNEMQEMSDKEANKQRWNYIFGNYAVPIEIQDNLKLHQFQFRIRAFPLDNTLHAEIAFEVYSKDKDYLFTFYADNYWNQDGYDEGEYWHQWNLTDSVKVKFPEKGKYYLVAGLPKSNIRNRAYQALKRYSNSRVAFAIYSGVQSVSYFYILVSMVLFSVISVFLLKRRSGAISNHIAINAAFNFELNDYLVKLPSNVCKDPLIISGFSRKKGSGSGESIELTLTQGGANTFLEMEREYEEGKTYFYCYYYGEFPEDDFKEIPRADIINFQGKKFKQLTRNGSAVFDMVYSNGLKEKFSKKITNFGTYDETEYLSFEYTNDPSEFDVSYGKEVSSVKIWEVKK